MENNNLRRSEIIGQNIKFFRKLNNNMSQAELSEKSKLPKTELTKLENGHVDSIDLNYLVSIAKVFNIPCEMLFIDFNNLHESALKIAEENILSDPEKFFLMNYSVNYSRRKLKMRK